jgi:hypothetical protein
MNKEQNLNNAENQQLNIAGVIASVSFQKELKEAIESGKETDYAYDGEDEYPVETYNEDWALKQVIEVIQKHLL